MIAPIASVQVPQGPRPKREFHELYMPMSQVFDKLKAKGLLKPLGPRPIPNPLPSRFDVNKRYAYHQVPGHETDLCFTLRHAIQDLIDNKVIALPTRPSITNDLLPNHNFGKGPRINCLMTEEENKEDLSDLIYDLPECFMMTWEQLMDRTFTTTTGYDIWNEIPEQENNQTSTNGGDTLNPKRIAKHPQMRRDTSNPKRIAKHSQIGGETSNPKTLIPVTQLKLTTSQGGRHFKPPHLEIDNPVEALNRSTQQTLVGENEVLK